MQQKCKKKIQKHIETNWNPTGYSFKLTEANWKKTEKQEKKRQLKLIEVNLYVK